MHPSTYLQPQAGEGLSVLDPPDRKRLERLTTQLAASKSDVLRRALAALESQLADPEEHPALRIVGIAAGYRRRSRPSHSAAREHDRILTEGERALWAAPRKRRRGR